MCQFVKAAYFTPLAAATTLDILKLFLYKEALDGDFLL